MSNMIQQPSNTLSVSKPPATTGIDTKQLHEIGQKILKNETGGRPENLIFWSTNEAFPSLGVGHFIWFPKGHSQGFTESFPSMIRFLEASKADVPNWLSAQINEGALWSSRDELERSRNTRRFKELQQLLIDTSGLQVLYLFKRLDAALPKILASLSPEKRADVTERFNTVKASRGGLYPLVDYVNFKGEGTVTSEKHNGVGWGLRQVLETMRATPTGHKALKEFARAADVVLTRRVVNAPPARNEQRWLPGWRVRLKTYIKQ
ncbi:hypothetical protein EOL70_00585 [Leucothrix sargassi]|nr:hypothetical protein EOL70_00585 [Leucothrix sargassi]